MFTGLVAAVGRVSVATIADSGLELRIEVPWNDLQLGESVAVDGACLTVKEVGAGWFGAHVVATSLGRTNFAAYTVGRLVNLERALAVGERLGGHLVQGHVDGIGTVLGVRTEGDAILNEAQHAECLRSIADEGHYLASRLIYAQAKFRSVP